MPDNLIVKLIPVGQEIAKRLKEGRPWTECYLLPLKEDGHYITLACLVEQINYTLKTTGKSFADLMAA